MSPEAWSLEDHRNIVQYTAEMTKCLNSFSYFMFNYAKTEAGEFPRWPYLVKAAEMVDEEIWFDCLKRRQAMWTHFASAVHVWAKWHGDTMIFSYNENHAINVCGKRVTDLDWRLPPWMRNGFSGASPIKWGGRTAAGSRRMTFPMPATEVGGIGHSLKLVTMDEFSRHPHGESNIREVTAALTNTPHSLSIVFSAAAAEDGPSGAWYERWKPAILGDREPVIESDEFIYFPPTQEERYAKLFTGRWCRPDQQGEEWFARELSSYDPRPTEEEIQALYPLTPAQAFLGRRGLVYPAFDANKHLREPEKPWSECLIRLIAEDPAGPGGEKQDPAAFIALGIYRRPGASQTHMYESDLHYHVYTAHYVRDAIGVQDIDAMLREWTRVAPLHAFVRPDDGGNETRMTLERMGWGGITRAGVREPQFRREQISKLLLEGRLTFSPHLRNIRNEFETMRWSEVNPNAVRAASGQMRIITGKDHHGDLVDALGYGVLATLKGLGNPSRGTWSTTRATGAVRQRASDLSQKRHRVDDRNRRVVS
jgi:hypothetical protein